MKTDILLQIALKKQRENDLAAEIIPANLSSHLTAMLDHLPEALLRAEHDNASREKILTDFRKYILTLKAQVADSPSKAKIYETRRMLKAGGNIFCKYVDAVIDNAALREETEDTDPRFISLLPDGPARTQ